MIKIASCDQSSIKCGIGKIDFILPNYNMTS